MLADMRDRALFSERELAAMTEQRDECLIELEIVIERLKGNRHPDDNGIMAKGEIDIKSITEQRDDCQLELQIVIERLKGNRHPDDNGMKYEGEIDLKAVTEQRDELAESLDFQLKLNRECIDQITARTKDRDEAREKVQLYRNFFCENKDEIKELLLPWETKDKYNKP